MSIKNLTTKLGIFLLATLLVVSIVKVASAREHSKATDRTIISISKTNLERLSTVITDVKKYYYKSLPDETLFTNAISGMLSALDPHSSYLGPEDLKDLQMATVGKFGGIGIEVIPDQGLIRVISPLDDTPASRAGIKAGDIVIQINDKLVKDMSLRDAVNLMRGPRGSHLILTILRKNETKPLTFNLIREIIKIKSVKQRLLEKNYGYLRIGFFQEETEADLAKEIKKLKKKNNAPLKGVILDLRNNPGGLLESAVQVADDFLDATKLKKNNLIVTTKGQSPEVQIAAHATPGELLPNVPMVILINEGSASAGEVVAGALQDHKRAIIVGTNSFGKGSVQTLIPLDDTSAIKLTTALYYTPLGKSIQAKGIAPDIMIEDIKVPRPKLGEDETIHFNEANLISHIKNGNDADEENEDIEDATAVEKSSITKSGAVKSNKSSLIYKDYQLFEALQILKSASILRNWR